MGRTLCSDGRFSRCYKCRVRGATASAARTKNSTRRSREPPDDRASCPFPGHRRRRVRRMQRNPRQPGRHAPPRRGGWLGGDGDGGGGAVVCDATQGNKVCFGLCVKIDQPNTGCGDSSCAACDPKNANSATCKGGATTLACAYDVCKPGFDNCDGQRANGCETSLNAKSSCGSCTTKWARARRPTVRRRTEPSAASRRVPSARRTAAARAWIRRFRWTTAAGAISRVRARRPRRRARRARASSRASPAPTPARTSAPRTWTRGSVATPANICPVRAASTNTNATCSSGTCGFKCAPGYLDCDGAPANGCEYKGEVCSVTLPDCSGGGLCPITKQCVARSASRPISRVESRRCRSSENRRRALTSPRARARCPGRRRCTS